jgi:hypothetical protein
MNRDQVQYAVSRIHCDRDPGLITELEVWEHQGDNVLTNPQIWTREQVITAIKMGYRFMTILINERTNSFTWDREVKLYLGRYLKTEMSRLICDQIDRLPNF